MPLKTKIKKPYYLNKKFFPLTQRVCWTFFISKSFWEWIRENKHRQYVSILKICKNKYPQTICRRTRILNEKTKFRFKLFFCRIFMERYIKTIYAFSVLLSWFCLPLEWSDQRNISQKHEIHKIIAFPFEIWNVEK